MCYPGEFPHYWDPIPLNPQTGNRSTLLTVILDPASDEYNDIKTAFDKTMSPSSGSTYRRYPYAYSHQSTYGSIIKIQRIQNPALYAMYMVKKREMDSKNNAPGQDRNERRLFHGTSVDTCSRINRYGFNRSYAGKNGKVICLC